MTADPRDDKGAPVRQTIEAYGDGRFRVSGAVFHGSILIRPLLTVPWAVRHVRDVDADALADALAQARAQAHAQAHEGGGEAELLLLGCGARQVQVPPAMRARLKAAGVALEAMDTGAACRTYNLLAAEDRRVAALLIAVA